MKLKNWLIYALLTCLVAGATSNMSAQQAPVEPRKLLPFVPVLVAYEFAPQYFMQWIDDNATYSMIEAMSTGGAAPGLQIILTESGSGRRVYYSNSQAQVEALTQANRAAFKAQIDYRDVKEVGRQPTYAFAFRDEHGQAIRWRFIQAAAASVQGAGLSPQSDAPGLRFKYRTRATAAGAGTAVQLGDKVVEAQPWPEISAPPYFVAYRGSYIESLAAGALLVGSESWKATAAPAELKEGAEWTLTDAQNHVRRLRITALRGDELTLTEIAAQQKPTSTLSMVVRRAADSLAVLALEVKSDAHVMRLTFTPELNLSAAALAAGQVEVAYRIDQDEQAKISQGVITVAGQGTAWRMHWQPRSPAWAKARVLDTVITFADDGYKIEAR